MSEQTFHDPTLNNLLRWNEEKAQRIATLTAERDSAKRELAELLADAKVERTKYEALKLERDGLAQQLADSELAFAHANEVVGKLEADVARLDWQPITPETQWEEATELGTFFEEPRQFFHTEWPEGMAGSGSMVGAYWMRKGYTLFRRLNAPARTAPRNTNAPQPKEHIYDTLPQCSSANHHRPARSNPLDRRVG